MFLVRLLAFFLRTWMQLTRYRQLHSVYAYDGAETEDDEGQATRTELRTIEAAATIEHGGTANLGGSCGHSKTRYARRVRWGVKGSISMG